MATVHRPSLRFGRGWAPSGRSLISRPGIYAASSHRELSAPSRNLRQNAEPDPRLQEFMNNEVEKFSAMRATPRSLQEILKMTKPWKAAKFIHSEVPVRYAERIRLIESLPDWRNIPELVEVHARHAKTFQDMRLVKTYPCKSSFSNPELVDTFTDLVRTAVECEDNLQMLIARAIHKLHQQGNEKMDQAFVDMWLDDFLLNWIGCRTLLSQYLACADGQHTGIVDPNCEPAQVCREAAREVQLLCEENHGMVPFVQVESHSASGADRGSPRFSYIPGYLKYIMVEILKNSCRSTLETCSNTREMQKRPVSVVVCADERRVAIKISDKAQGIPFEVGTSVWSYLYSTAKINQYKTERDASKVAPLSGYGVGLPLSRLYARYLGGSLGLLSWPGYGTDVHIFLRRLTSEQVEVVPGDDDDLTAMPVTLVEEWGCGSFRNPAGSQESGIGYYVDGASRVAIPVGDKAAACMNSAANGNRNFSTILQSQEPTLSRSSQAPVTEKKTFPHSRAVSDVRFNPRGTGLCTAGGDGIVRTIDIATGKEEIFDHKQPVWNASISPMGDLLCTASNDGSARVYEIESQEVFQIFGHRMPVRSANFNFDGSHVCTASGDGSARVYDTDSGACVQRFEHGAGWVFCADFDPTGKYLVTAAADKRARVFDIKSGKLELEIPHTGWVTTALFSPDGKNICTVCNKSGVHIFDAKTGQVVSKFPHTSLVWSAQYNPAGNMLCTASTDSFVRVFDVASEEETFKIEHVRPVRKAVFSPTGNTIAAACEDRNVYIHPIAM